VTRRTPRLITSLAAVAAVSLSGLLASCGAVQSSSEAFSVNGESYSREDVSGLLDGLVLLQQLNAPNGVAPAADVAEIISVMIQYRAGAAVLEDWGTPVTDAERAQAAGPLTAQLPPGISEGVKDLLVDLNLTGKAVDAVKTPSAAEVETMYSAAPASTGHLCIRLATLKSAGAARDMIDAVNGGGDFAALATKSGAEDGGIVTGGNGSPCLTLDAMRARLGGTAVGALISSPSGRPTEAFEDEDGWHVAVHRPWDEIKSDLMTSLSAAPGRSLISGVLATADIRVNSVYGTWNTATSRVE